MAKTITRNNLKGLRIGRGYSYETLAHHVGVSKNTVNNWEKGHTDIPGRNIDHIHILDGDSTDLCPGCHTQLGEWLATPPTPIGDTLPVLKDKTRDETREKSEQSTDNGDTEVVPPELSFFFILQDDKLVVITSPTCEAEDLLIPLKNDVTGGVEVDPPADKFVLPFVIDGAERVFTVVRPIRTRLSYADFVQFTREFVCEDDHDLSDHAGGTDFYFTAIPTNTSVLLGEAGK